ncbi:hypothetical protein Bca52824_077811 [Brassica carinata]|uniref:Uncharacterized protein n=1 Tax=Brassica carinata TaxID=52824 RepID=A0A8X7PWE0_BRACI|nr:hypothetical protein Bca52824_077811 [Brassica carinata]
MQNLYLSITQTCEYFLGDWGCVLRWRKRDCYCGFLSSNGTAKLTGFCVCVSIPEGQTFVKIDAVRADGVLDYLEYKYMTSDVVTENTDVFSSGVLLQNLLIGKHGVMNLMRVSDRVCKFVEEGRIVEILDPQMLENMDDDETGELERRQMEAVLSNAREMDV